MGLMGVVIVTYNSGNQICDCLDSLMASEMAARLRIVLVDNASLDATCDRIRSWAGESLSEKTPDTRVAAPITLLPQASNKGFAAGVNIGLNALCGDPEIDRFWVLNPDTLVPPTTPGVLLSESLDFGLLGMRLCYAHDRDRVQLDGGIVDWRTGQTRSIHVGDASSATPLPDDRELGFVSGAAFVISRPFLEEIGPMTEAYFLYYEEVDWAMRRGDFKLRLSRNALVYHVAGASIGSPTLERGPSPLSHYYKHRSRMQFLRKWSPASVPTGYAFGLAKAVQALMTQGWPSALAILLGQFGAPMPRFCLDQASKPDSSAKNASRHRLSDETGT